MNADLTAVLYIVAGVLFILALRGLSSPETARQGNRFGIAGMAVAVLATLFSARFLAGATAVTWPLVLIAIALGAVPGALIARRVAMTSMPQLVAAFHALVGLAAVLIAWAAFLAPRAYGIGVPGEIEA